MAASKYDNLKIGKIAQTHLKDALENGSVSDAEIKKMMESKGEKGDEKNHYSRLTFGLNFPLLAKERSDFYDGKVYRYYSTPITIRGKQYYLCSQWFEGSRSKLVAWLDSLGGTAKSRVAKSTKTSKPKASALKATHKEKDADNDYLAFESLLREADNGDAEAQFNVAEYYCGVGEFAIDIDYDKAFHWYTKAAEQGHAGGQSGLGSFYATISDDFGVPKDDEKAIYWFTQAAMQNNLFAQMELLRMIETRAERGDADAQYELGSRNHAADRFEQAVYWYEKAAAQGYDGAQSDLGNMYLYGHGVEQDFKKALDYLMKAGAQDNTGSLYSLGFMYHRGFGVEQDYKKAASWFEKATELGDSDAQFTYACMLMNGHGVEQNKEKAISLLGGLVTQGHEEAIGYLERLLANNEIDADSDGSEFDAILKDAESGDAKAQYELGTQYHDNCNFEQAAYWYEKAAGQGYAAAQSDLGTMYLSGEGVDKDVDKVVYYLEKASAQGNLAAIFNLGSLYYQGHGVEQDYKKAAYYFEKASELGDSDAQYNYAYMLMTGLGGVEQSKTKALSMLNAAAQQGHEQAIKLMDTLLVGDFNGGDGDILEAVVEREYYLKCCYDGDSTLTITLYAPGSILQKREGILKFFFDHIKELPGVREGLSNHSELSGVEATARFKLNVKGDGIQLSGDDLEMSLLEQNAMLFAIYVYSQDPDTVEFIEIDADSDGSEFDAILKDAESGDAKAQHLLAEIYFGEGELDLEIEEDYEKAFYWYEKAAEQGHSGAQYSLGVFYATTFDDFGVPKDDRKALYWFDQAQKQDDNFAKIQLDRLLNKITSDVAAVPVQGADDSEYSRFINNQQNIYPIVRPIYHTLAMPWVTGLNILFGVDAGNMVSLLNPDEIPPGITPDQIMNLACGNLRKYKGTFEINTYDNGIYWLRTPDDTAYAASFLLLDTFLEAAALEIRENIVFAVPTRQDVWFIGQSQKDKVVFLMMGAASQHDGAGKQAVLREPLLYDFKTKKFRVFDPDTDL